MFTCDIPFILARYQKFEVKNWQFAKLQYSVEIVSWYKLKILKDLRLSQAVIDTPL